MILEMIPLILLYEFSIWLASVLGRPSAEAGGARSPPPRAREPLAFAPHAVRSERKAPPIGAGRLPDARPVAGRRTRAVRNRRRRSGGLFNAFKGDGGGGDTNAALEERIDRQEQRLQANPANVAVLQVARARQLPARHEPAAVGRATFPDDARDDLQKAASYWQRYLEAESEEPNASTALYALRVYDVGALNQPKEATRAASIIAEAQNDPNAYLQLVAYAALAKDERTADLAAQKAVDLAPKNQRKQVKQQADALRQQQQAQPQGG